MKGVWKRLLYGSIDLVPVDNSDDLWHVHGRITMSTRELTRLATKRGVQVVLSEVYMGNRTLRRLN